MAELTEIRWHGRGGQGVVTAGRLLAETALGSGQYFQAFPDFGPERMGAPIRAFTRLSSEPITIHAQIEEPDTVNRYVDTKLVKGIAKQGGEIRMLLDDRRILGRGFARLAAVTAENASVAPPV